ncbi:hypothetical protein JTE90_018030 [Oedothorax gibbosus]|uniref:tRNA-binding domain-containing protein n=1 Tax=Oedothorax gibbosus TaxID=931172 RepID=A0AAV6V9G3_9ARAC|nr:hypothetical protein JTE90_018030 [Oedothorax gibbosus]
MDVNKAQQSQLNILKFGKMSDAEILQRIQQNNARGEEIVQFIQRELPSLQHAAAQKQQQKLADEIRERNQQLKAELEYWMKKVTNLEILSGIKQYSLPSDKGDKISPPTQETKVPTQAPAKPAKENQVSEKPKAEQPAKESKKDQPAKETKKEKAPKAAKPEKQPADDGKEVNVSRLDLRIGRILNAKKHPDAESLYVEEIDVGEDKPRTVVSGLVKFVPLEEMQNRMVVVLCNLKPAKMRGVTSEAMVMCASTAEKVEILSPPEGSVPGDRVVCDEFPGEPDATLPPKKKIFEQVAPDLKTDGGCNATYKSSLLKVAGKGVVKSASLTNVQIK